jgi:hypothetical protein
MNKALRLSLISEAPANDRRPATTTTASAANERREKASANERREKASANERRAKASAANEQDPASRAFAAKIGELRHHLRHKNPRFPSLNVTATFVSKRTLGAGVVQEESPRTKKSSFLRDVVRAIRIIIISIISTVVLNKEACLPFSKNMIRWHRPFSLAAPALAFTIGQSNPISTGEDLVPNFFIRPVE